MPANRAEAFQAAEDAAPAETPPPARRGGGFMAWLPLLLTVALMPALAWSMTEFVLLPRIQSGLGITAAAAAGSGTSAKSAASASGKKVTVAMDKLLVNVAGTMGSRYLLVSLSAVSTDPHFQDKMQNNDAALRDAACGTLASETLADLEKPDARNLIRNELISDFNNILGADEVEEIYLTEFAIQ